MSLKQVHYTPDQEARSASAIVLGSVVIQLTLLRELVNELNTYEPINTDDLKAAIEDTAVELGKVTDAFEDATGSVNVH